MKNLLKKIISYGVALVVFVQFSFMAPQRAQAGTIETVISVVGLIEVALKNNWPADLLKPTQIYALINLIGKCNNPANDEALMACVEQASADPILGPLLKTSEGMDDIKKGFAIYLDIKNSDYVKLIQDGGKPIGCAAAAIFTGFDICGALDEFIAIAEAVGEAAEYAFSWLDDVDAALFGQVPHMNQEQYFDQRWKPYIRSYAALKDSANESVSLQPYLSSYGYYICGNLLACGLENRSLSKIYEDCNSYYENFKDDNGGSICANNKATFLNQAKALVQAANMTMQVAPVLQAVLDGQNKIWNDKLTEFKESLKTTFPEYKNDVLDQSKYDKYTWDKYANFTKSVEKKVGKITAGTYCADANAGAYECIDIEKGDGTCCGTIAAKTYANLYESNFKKTPLDAANEAVGSAQEILQNYFKWLKADIENFWQLKRESENSWKKQNFINEAKNKLYALKNICNSLTNYQENGTPKFANACYNSEPLESCSSKIDSLANQQVSSGDAKATNDFIESNKPAIESCLKGSETVTKEWQRMNNLYYPFIDGWYQYYQDHFKGYYKNKNKGEKSGSIPKEKMAISLEIEYTNCAVFHMEDVIQKAIDQSNGKIAVFVGKPIGSLAKEAAKAVARTGVTKYKAGIGNIEAQPPTIAEGFCKDKGLAVVTHDYEVKNNYDTDGRDLGMKEEAKKAASASNCAVHEFTDAQGQHSDEFHLKCDNKDKYDKCVKSLGGDIRPSKARCTVSQGTIATSLVDIPCCEATYQSGAFEIKKEIDAKDLTNGAKGAMTAAAQAAANGKTFKVTVAAGMGGSVTPMGVQSVAAGKTATFTIMANAGNKIKSVTGCGAKVKMGNIYETEAINSDCSLSVAFEKTLAIQGRPTTPGAIPTGAIPPGAITPRTSPASGTAPIHMIPIQPGVIKKRK